MMNGCIEVTLVSSEESQCASCGIFDGSVDDGLCDDCFRDMPNEMFNDNDDLWESV